MRRLNSQKTYPMKHLLSALMSCLALTAFTQPTLNWDRFYDNPASEEDELKDIVVDAQGYAYVTGHSFNGTNDDVVTIKYSPGGQVVWTKTFNGSGNADDYAKVVRLDASGNVIVGGRSYSSGNGFDFLVIKYDGAGTLMWSDTVNGLANGYDEINDIAIDNAGKIYCVGNTANNGTIVVYNPNSATPIWTNTLTVGAPWYHKFTKVLVTNSGMVKVLDQYGNPSSQNDIRVVTYNSSGVYQGFFYWTALLAKYPIDMAHDEVSGTTYVCAYALSGTGQENIEILSTAYQIGYWASYIGSGTANSRPSDIVVNSGSVYVTGHTDADASNTVDMQAITLKFSPNGTTGQQQWAMQYGSTGVDNGVALTILGSNTYVVGYTTLGNGTTDIMTLKYANATGALASGFPLTYVNSANSTALYDEIPVGIHVPNANSIYVGGYTTSSNQNHNRDFLILRYCSFQGTPSAGSDVSICQNATGQLQASGGVSYAWTPGTWLSSTTSASPIVSPGNASPSTQQYICTISDANSCSVRDTAIVTVLQTPPAPPTPTASGSTTICSGNTVQLCTSGSGTFTWYGNSGLINPPVTTACWNTGVSANYTVTTTVNGCVSPASGAISVQVVTVSTSVSVGGSATICEGASVTLTANTSGGSLPYTYDWSPNGEETQTIPVGDADSYSVTTTDANGCSSTSNSQTITVTPLPIASFSVNELNQPTIAFTNASQYATSYQWDYADGNTSTTSSASHNHIYATNGMYTIRLIANSSCGADTAYQSVNILSVGMNHAPDNYNLSVQPNPSTGIISLNIESSTTEDFQIEVVNTIGQQVFQKSIRHIHGTSTATIDLTDFSEGVYVLNARCEKRTFSERLIIRR